MLQSAPLERKINFATNGHVTCLRTFLSSCRFSRALQKSELFLGPSNQVCMTSVVIHQRFCGVFVKILRRLQNFYTMYRTTAAFLKGNNSATALYSRRPKISSTHSSHSMLPPPCNHMNDFVVFNQVSNLVPPTQIEQRCPLVCPRFFRLHYSLSHLSDKFNYAR